MESFAIYILTYKIKYAKLCENKFLSHFAFLLLALIFRWLSWKLKYTLYLISWVYNVEDSCQIMHHCQSRNQADAETIFTINYLLITKFWEAFSYLPLSEELISGDQIWLDGKNRIAQPKGSIINYLFRFEARKPGNILPSPNTAWPGVAGGPVLSSTNSSPLLWSGSTLTVYNLCRMYNFSLSVFLATT